MNSKLMRWLLFFWCSLFLSTITISQESPRALKKTGESFFENKQYHAAYEQLEQYHRLRSKDDDIWDMLGIAAYHVNDLSLAEQLLQQVVQESKTIDPDVLLFLAKTYQLQHQFEQAALTFKKFLINTKRTHPLHAMVVDEISRCGYALRKNYNDPAVIVENLGKQVNDKMDDFAPILSPIYQDRLYFSSIRPNNLGGRRDKNGLQREEGFYRSDMYRTEVSNGNWAATRPMTALLNSTMNDVILDFNSDGQVLYYFKGLSLYAGEAFVDTFKTIEERTLFSPKLNTPYQPELGDTAPFFYDDNTLIFASRRAGGFGGLDLYWSAKTDDEWSTPRNMGSSINSAYDETTPFLAIDGQTLYFSSNHSSRSLGDFDIFKAEFSIASNTWGAPQNLGLPINSGGDDRHFRLAQDGYRAFFSSRRSSSIGGQDIFMVYFKTYQVAQQRATTQTIFSDAVLETAEKPPKNTEANPLADNIITYTIEPLFFENENDILNYRNTQQLQQVASILQQYPTLKILINAHSDGSEPEKFDLFFSIKRAERVRQFLLENDVNRNQIILQGVGGNYPLAKEILDGQPNPLGKKINRRITIDLLDSERSPIRLESEYPAISPLMQTPEFKFHKNIQRGLAYRVQIAASPTMYNGDLISNYPHPLIEQATTSDMYRYSVGRYSSYSSARELQKEIINQGVNDAFVVAYVNGARVSPTDAISLSDQYPDLKNYTASKTKEE